MTFDDSSEVIDAMPAPSSDEPHAVALRNADRADLNRAIASLPVAFREVLVLRELEDCSYSDIARIPDIPIGTVMSRLARARAQIKSYLDGEPPARILDIQPRGIHQRTSVLMGSSAEVQNVLRHL